MYKKLILLTGLIPVALLLLRTPDVGLTQSVDPLPQLAYLGHGAGTYTADPGWNFIVKRLNPFRFEFVPGPTYTATDKEDVWMSFGTNGAPPAVYHVDTIFGQVSAGCVIQFVEIDDQIDDRLNYFLIDDEVIYEIAQGMVSTGSFTIPRDGVLNYYVNDSIGMYIDICSTQATTVPTATPLPTETPIVTPSSTATPTNTPLPTETATALPSTTPPPAGTPTETPIPTGTIPPTAPLPPTATITATAPALPTATLLPTATVTPLPGFTVTPLPTKKPHHSDQACARINFEVSGDSARSGDYELIEANGRFLTTWHGEDGWQDSGWIPVKISYPSVHVRVLYRANPTATPVEMRIVNPAPDTPFGWLTEDICHAVEVAWPTP